ncbi:MAG: ABC transporter permease [Anaerolineae bacterium]
MRFTRNFQIALDALMANKLRSFLTMLGIIIGVGSVVALLSIGSGAQDSITQQINGIGTNLVTVVPGQLNLTGGGNSIRTPSQVKPITYENSEYLRRNVSNIDGVAPEYTRNNLTVSYQRTKVVVTVRGVTTDYERVRNIELTLGRWIANGEDESGARVAVIGPDVAEALFGQLDPIGERIKIDNVSFTVIGLTKAAGSSFAGNSDTSVFIPLSAMYRNIASGRLATGERSVSVIYISANDNDDIPWVEAEVTEAMRGAQRLKPDEDNGFTVLTQTQFLSIAGTITGILTIFLGAIAGISLLVGGIGIMNIMLVSVTERTKEIGLRKAVGAKKSTILMQFLVETVTLSVIGGVLGILLGSGVALLVGATGVINATITTESIVLAFTFSLAVGLFFGIYPANRAAGLQPIEALRYE